MVLMRHSFHVCVLQVLVVASCQECLVASGSCSSRSKQQLWLLLYSSHHSGCDGQHAPAFCLCSNVLVLCDVPILIGIICLDEANAECSKRLQAFRSQYIVMTHCRSGPRALIRTIGCDLPYACCLENGLVSVWPVLSIIPSNCFAPGIAS